MTTTFQQQLGRWGPQADHAVPTLAEAQAYCRKLAQTHYENFPVASVLLPRRLRQHFYNVYAYCRWADDLADEISNPEQSLSLLEWWRQQLADCYSGRARHPVFVALRTTIEEFSIPPGPFIDLISAFEQDQRVAEYETFEQLLDYCRRSADPVGRIVLYLCGQYSEQHASWSDSICTGLQLANFWQDVRRDLDLGRVYLPREDRERHGYTDNDLRGRTTNNAFVELMRFQVDRTREFLRAGVPLVDRMPGRLQIDIDLFIRGGIKILDRIAAIQYRVWDTRPVVSKADAFGLLLSSLGSAVGRRLGLRRTKPADETAVANPQKAAQPWQ